MIKENHMKRAELVRELNALGRTMRLAVLNIGDDKPVLTEILIRTLITHRAMIDALLPHIPRHEMLALNTRLGPHVESLIAEGYSSVPDFVPEEWV